MSKTNGKPRGPSRIYWIGGSRGGVGKSMMTVVILGGTTQGGDRVDRTRTAALGGELRPPRRLPQGLLVRDAASAGSGATG